MKNTLFIVASISAICTLSFAEINIDNNLAEQMKVVCPNGTVSTLVYLNNQVDVKALSDSISEVKMRHQERHQLVVETLQTTAIDSQVSILQEIDTLNTKGAVSRVQPFWISNVIRVDASPSVIQTLAEREDVLHIYLNYPIELVAPVSTGPVRRRR